MSEDSATEKAATKKASVKKAVKPVSAPPASMDPARSRLRATVDAIEKQVAGLPKDAAGEALGASWTDLVGQLALGPEPEVRNCPKCGGLGARMATVCGTCWTKLTPPDDD